MAKWRNVMTMVLVAGSLALAQYDYDYDESTSSDTEQSYSYGESDGEDDFDKMDAADAEKKAKEEADKPIPTAEEDDSKVGKATASGDEWEGFRYEEIQRYKNRRRWVLRRGGVGARCPKGSPNGPRARLRSA